VQCETPPPPAMRPLIEKTLALDEWQQRIVFWGGAIATGAVAVLFAKASDAAMLAFETARQWLSWWPYCAAPVGLALSAWLTQRLFVGAQGSGIPQTIAALSLSTEEARHQVLSLKIAIGKILLTLIALACGASVGREARPFRWAPRSCTHCAGLRDFPPLMSTAA
jgi:H+/Cl- antiporter ClcA